MHVSVTPDDRFEIVRIKLPITITGTIYDDVGPWTSDRLDRIEMTFRDDATVLEATVEPDGSYSVVLAPGSYTIFIRVSLNEPSHLLEVMAEPAVLDVDTELDIHVPTRPMTFRVLDMQDQPVVGAELSPSAYLWPSAEPFPGGRFIKFQIWHPSGPSPLTDDAGEVTFEIFPSAGDIPVRLSSSDGSFPTQTVHVSVTPDDRFEIVRVVGTKVTTPGGGSGWQVTVTYGEPRPPAGGFEYIGQQVTINAPQVAPSPTDPYVITFGVAAEDIPSGETAASIEVFRNGTLVPACDAPGSGHAIPSPCVEKRETLSGGDVAITVLTVAASTWDLGVQVDPLEGPQTITFDPLPDATYGDPAVTLTASASSGLPVSFSASGECTVSGSELTLVAVGQCTVTASQSGDVDWLPASDVERTFSITDGTVTPPPATTKLIDDKSPGFSKTKTGWMKQSYGWAKRSFWTPVRRSSAYRSATWKTSLDAPGRYAVWVRFPKQHATTRQAMYEIYTADGKRTRTVDQYQKRDTWVNLGTYRFGNVARVKLADKTGEKTSTRRSVAFDVVKFVPASGTASIAEAVEAEPTFELDAESQPQVITFDPLPDATMADSPLTLVASASSTLLVSFAALGDCSVEADQLTLTSAGSCSVTASQAGDLDWLPAGPVERTFAIAEWTEPTPEAPTESVAEPTPEPTPKPTAEPAAEPIPEVPAESVAEPTPEPPVEPTPEFVAAPTPEPTPENQLSVITGESPDLISETPQVSSPSGA